MKSPAENDYLFSLVLITSVLCMLLLIYFIIFTFLSGAYTLHQAIIQEEDNNPAKQLAAIIPPIASQYQFKKTAEKNGVITVDNAVPYYSYTYQTRKTPDEIIPLLSNYLKTKGYTIKKTSFSQNTLTQPYFIEENSSQDIIEVDLLPRNKNTNSNTATNLLTEFTIIVSSHMK